MEAIFDFANEKYDTSSKGLLPFRAPTADEKAVTLVLPPPGRQDQSIRTSTNPPPPIEYHDNGLTDIDQIHKDWEKFKADHSDMKCEKFSDTEFQVYAVFFES